jgi:hypothetical protein
MSKPKPHSERWKADYYEGTKPVTVTQAMWAWFDFERNEY